MPLVEVTQQPDTSELPRDVRRFLAEAENRIDDFLKLGRAFGFVPSDYESAYRALRSIAESSVARGRQFCEWGSGFGVVTGLAALLEFDACGIEFERELVDHARKLAEEFDLPVEFALGSFVPQGGESKVYAAGEYAWFATDSDFAYEDLGLDPDDFDLIFAYPWPDEEEITFQLFEQFAGDGALLLTFHGGDDFRLHRKVRANPSKSGKKRKR